MRDRSGHYEAAFQELLRTRGIPYVAVDDAKRALFAQAPLKSFDFVVYSQRGRNLLVDVKGRSRQGATGRSSMQNWVTQSDIEDLGQWQTVFGEGFEAVLAFVYWIEPALVPEPGVFEHAGRWYQVLVVKLDEYRALMRRRSVKWDTVSLRADDFRQLARPIDELI